MKPRGVGQSGRIPISSITTRSTEAATSRPGRSRNSFHKRSARASDHCANSGAEDVLKLVDKGGHFAAWEEPALFTAEVRAAFRSRPSLGRGWRAPRVV